MRVLFLDFLKKSIHILSLQLSKCHSEKPGRSGPRSLNYFKLKKIIMTAALTRKVKLHVK